MNYKIAIFRKIDSCFRLPVRARTQTGTHADRQVRQTGRNDSGQKIDSSVIARSNSSSVIARSEATKQSRKTNLLFFIFILILITSFLASGASAQDIYITNIGYEKVPNYTHLTIKANGAISEFNTSYLEDPERIVIEINNATFNINMIYNIEKLNRDIALLSNSSVKKIECTQIEDKAPEAVKIIINLSKKVNYEIYLSDDKTLLYIDINDYSESEELEKKTSVSLLDETTVENNQGTNTYSTDTETVKSIETSSDKDITNIWGEKVPNYTHLTIKASGAISEYETFYLENPERIVIDIHNVIYNIKELSDNILVLNMGAVKQVRCGQFENQPIPITRFVVDLFQKANYEVKLSSDKRLLYIEVYDYFEFKAPEEQVFTVTPVKGEVEKIEKEEAPEISLIDKVTEQITLNLKEAEVLDAIRALSEISGINIIADDSVTGNITLNLKDVPFKDALGLILKIKGLDYTEVSNTLIIASKEVIEGYKKPITRIFELKNATAEGAKAIIDGNKKEGSKIIIVADARMNNLIVTGTVEEIERIESLIAEIDTELLTRTFKIDNAIYKDEIEAIKNMLSIIISDEKRINIDSRQCEIMVKGTKEELDNVETIIAGLDKRAPQIMIEAKVVEITLDGEKDLGINWTAGVKDKDGNLLEGQITIGELTLGGSLERSGLIEATLKALQTEGKTNILSNPKALTLDGKEAKILSGSKIPIRIITPEGLETVEYRDVGLSMTITPRLSSDGLITMDVNQKIESLGEEEPIQGYPVINSREEKVIIRANLDDTVVIGGLITSRDIKNISKIPFLADIPIFGKLFQFTHTENKKTEIIILITAHLLDY